MLPVELGSAAVLVLLAVVFAVGLPGSGGPGLSTGFAMAAALLVPLGAGGLGFTVRLTDRNSMRSTTSAANTFLVDRDRAGAAAVGVNPLGGEPGPGGCRVLG